MTDKKDEQAMLRAIQQFIADGGAYEEAVAAIKAVYGPGAEEKADDSRSTTH